MRSYLAMELIATLWIMGATLAATEGMGRLWIFCCAMAMFYFLRAGVKYFTSKEKTNEKTHFVAGPGGCAIRVRSDGDKPGWPGNFTR